MKRHIIYDNYDIYSDDMQACARETFELQGVEDITDEMIYRECEAQDAFNFQNEYSELESHDEGELVAIVNIGRWDGRCAGYKLIPCIVHTLYSDYDYESLYIDSNGDLRKEESHHDGNNTILYRYWKDKITDIQKENFLDKIYNGKCTQRDITRYTRKAGLAVADAYGWYVRR